MTAARLVSDVAAAAIGRWPDLLTAVGIDTPFSGKHGPCPACGGKDRFRFDNKGGRGTWICNQCGAGDGLDLVGKVTGKLPKEVAESKLEPRLRPSGTNSNGRKPLVVP